MRRTLSAVTFVVFYRLFRVLHRRQDRDETYAEAKIP